ncbi:MAG: hypothetical protein AAFO04_11905 [Cyanobacteria bacterium J06592_8]
MSKAINKYTGSEQRPNWLEPSIYSGLPPCSQLESMIIEDIESMMQAEFEPEAQHQSSKTPQNGRLYCLCALTTIALLGLSLFSQLPQLSRASTEVQHSVSAELLRLMNY